MTVEGKNEEKESGDGKDGEDEEEEEVEEMTGADQKEEEERQMRVSESLQLYRAQQQAKKDSKKKQKEGSLGGEQGGDKTLPSQPTAVSTTAQSTAKSTTAGGFSKLLMDANKAAAAERKTIDTPSKNSFYWSEGMDVKLAQAVHKNVFDFYAVAKELQGSMTAKDLGSLDAAMLTEVTCRERWCELDMDDTSEVDFSAEAKPNIMLGKGGRQLSFAELQAASSVQASSLLKVPNVLPGVTDEDEDDEGDEILDMAALRSKFVTNFETLD